MTEPATAQAITAIVPARDPVEDRGADHELAGHRDRHGRAGDRGRCGRRCARCARAPRARRARALALLARADDVEERVVDADRHPDQQHDRLDAGVEREELADRPEQPEGGDDRGRPRAAPARARRRARRRRSAARAGSPAPTGAPPAGGRCCRRPPLDRRERLSCGCPSATAATAAASASIEKGRLIGPVSRAECRVGRDASRDLAAERVLHAARRPSRSPPGTSGSLDSERVAVQVGVFDLAGPRLVLPQHARRRAQTHRRAALERLRARRRKRADARDHEREPERDREPRMPRCSSGRSPSPRLFRDLASVLCVASVPPFCAPSERGSRGCVRG